MFVYPEKVLISMCLISNACIYPEKVLMSNVCLKSKMFLYISRESFNIQYLSDINCLYIQESFEIKCLSIQDPKL